MPNLSVIIPIYNEAEGIDMLFKKLKEVLAIHEYEIIAVNDGSKDNSWSELLKVAGNDKHIKLINFRRNYGQTAAINAGIQSASGDIIVMIDSDLENDPADIPKLLSKLDEGFDVVSGWRKERWEKQVITRKLPSMLANKLISKVSGVNLHDYGCTLKVYKKEFIKDVKLYGEMHRFIPIFCKWQGGKITEIPVRYTPRKYGKGNYGLSRTYKVILDVLLIKFLDKYMQRPIHFFGGAGILSFIVMFLATGLAVYFKLTHQKDFVQTPLPTIAAMFFLVGVLMILLGILSEMLMRIYYESQESFPFKIKEKINF